MTRWGLDTLARLAQQAEARSDWADFGRYCRLQSQGLRRPAFAALDAFLSAAVEWPLAMRLDFFRWYAKSVSPSGDPAPFTTEPLCLRLLRPTAVEWVALRPELAEAHLWAGIFGDGDRRAALRRALSLDPSLRRARRLLVQWLLGDVDYNQHHMPDFYINNLRVDLAELREILALAADDDDVEWREMAVSEVAEKQTITEAWLADHPREGDFAVDRA